MTDKVLMTPEGRDQVLEELKRLKGAERVRVIEEIRVAREHGDLSENAEYEAAKEKQGMIEARVRLLEDRLARAEVVANGDEPPDRVRFGTTVVLEDVDSGEQVTWRIVGEDEADPASGLLSFASPVARALIGKAVDDTAIVNVPAGRREYDVLEIRFGA